VPEKLVEALDITTQLAMAAGLDALREAVSHWCRLTRRRPPASSARSVVAARRTRDEPASSLPRRFRRQSVCG
jgi:hypothetical protein